MGWPGWIDEIKRRYLADEGNLLLLHGDVDGRWEVDGEELDTVAVLVRFLASTRQVVGVLRAGSGLGFPNLGDLAYFERLVAVGDLGGARITGDASQPEVALARVWRALQGTGYDQAYLLPAAQELYPARRKRLLELAAGTPPLHEWADPLSRTNHLVVLLAPSLAEVRSEVRDVAVCVPVRAGGRAEVDPEVEISELLGESRPASDPAADRAAALAELETRPSAPTTTLLADALRATIPAHPVDSWSARLPVMDAVARVIADAHGPCGQLAFSLDEHGGVRAEGTGAEWLLDAWRGDIALDAAAGMLLAEIAVPEGQAYVEAPEELHSTALKALARRVEKLLAA